MASGRVPNTNITFFIKFVSNFSQITLLYNAQITLIERITLIEQIAQILFFYLNLLFVIGLLTQNGKGIPITIIYNNVFSAELLYGFNDNDNVNDNLFTHIEKRERLGKFLTSHGLHR
jgi:hypothetical protein